MPLYEYRCDDCAEVCEILQKITDPPPSACESCGGSLSKLISPPAIKFKGSGFYINDYAGKSGKSPGSSSEGDKASSSKAEGSGTGEKKSAATADSAKSD